MPHVSLQSHALPTVGQAMAWRQRGAQLAEAIASQDPAFKEKLEAAKARRAEIVKRLRFIQKPRPDLMEKFDTFDGITIARRGIDARKGS